MKTYMPKHQTGGMSEIMQYDVLKASQKLGSGSGVVVRKCDRMTNKRTNWKTLSTISVYNNRDEL